MAFTGGLYRQRWGDVRGCEAENPALYFKPTYDPRSYFGVCTFSFLMAKQYTQQGFCNTGRVQNEVTTLLSIAVIVIGTMAGTRITIARLRFLIPLTFLL